MRGGEVERAARISGVKGGDQVSGAGGSRQVEKESRQHGVQDRARHSPWWQDGRGPSPGWRPPVKQRRRAAQVTCRSTGAPQLNPGCREGRLHQQAAARAARCSRRACPCTTAAGSGAAAAELLPHRKQPPKRGRRGWPSASLLPDPNQVLWLPERTGGVKGHPRRLRVRP